MLKNKGRFSGMRWSKPQVNFRFSWCIERQRSRRILFGTKWSLFKELTLDVSPLNVPIVWQRSSTNMNFLFSLWKFSRIKTYIFLLYRISGNSVRVLKKIISKRFKSFFFKYFLLSITILFFIYHLINLITKTYY